MFIGVAFNFHYRKKMSTRTAIALTTLLVAMFSCSLHFGFFRAFSLVPSYIAAVTLFVVAYGFSKFAPRIPTVSFWADISYPLYVIHAATGYMLMAAMKNIGLPPSATIAIAFCLTTIAAFLIHKYVERPTHRMGQRIALRLQQRPKSNYSNSDARLEKTTQSVQLHPYHPGDVAEPADFYVAGNTITISGTPSLGTFAQSTRTGYMEWISNTFSGSATGARYNVATGGGSFVNGGGASYLPGKYPKEIATAWAAVFPEIV